MKAKIRAIIVLSALCVCLAAVYILLPSNDASVSRNALETTAPEKEMSILVTDIPVNEVRAMALSNDRVTAGIINDPEGIRAVPGSGESFDTEHMRALVYLACHLPAIRLLENHPLPPEAETQNSPARFSLILTDGREYNFVLLGKSPVSDDYLLYSEGQQSVFLISADNAQWFLRGADDEE